LDGDEQSCQAIIVNTDGVIVDAVYYNNLMACNMDPELSQPTGPRTTYDMGNLPSHLVL